MITTTAIVSKIKSVWAFIAKHWVTLLVLSVLAYGHFKIEGLKTDLLEEKEASSKIASELQANKAALDELSNRSKELEKQVGAAVKAGEQVRSRTSKKAEAVLSKPELSKQDLDEQIREMVNEWQN